MRFLSVFVICLFFLISSEAQELTQIQKEAIEELLKPYLRMDRPGFAILISRGDQILVKKGYGMADLEHGIPINPKTVFYAGSVSKQFVASCVLFLSEQGKIDLDASIQSYFPDFPEYGESITVRHLLHHTSGLKDYFEIFEAHNIDYLNQISTEEVYNLIRAESKLIFAPGEKYQYSNSGYLLLGMLVQRVSGQRLAEFAEEHIFKPLGMWDSRFLDNASILIPNRAFGYRINLEDEVENMFMRFDLVGSGGLYTTVEDLHRWDQNFYHRTVGTEDFFATLLKPGQLNNGRGTGYACALRIGSFQGYSVIGHSGSLGGYRAHYMLFPSLKLGMIILGNRADLKPGELTNEIAKIILDRG